MMALLVVVAVIHTQSRIGGALATVGWCVAAFVFGYLELAKRPDGVVFLEVQTPKWVFFVVVGGVAAWNCLIVGKALSRRVMGSKTPTPSTSTPPPAP